MISLHTLDEFAARMPRSRKIAAVLVGYLAAFGVASLGVWLYVRATDNPDRLSSGGMYAFGDSIVFLGIFCIASLPATGAALFFLRASKRFWNALAVGAVAIAATGIASTLASFVEYGINGPRSWIQTMAMLSPLRALAAPGFALCSFVAAILAPTRRPRIALFIVAAIEALVLITFALQMYQRSPR
jgi:hypothetical protein